MEVDEDKLRAAANRGIQAKALINDPLLNETLAYLDETYIAKWRVCMTPETREKCWDLVRALNDVRDHLVTVLSNGRLADNDIENLAKMPRRRAA